MASSFTPKRSGAPDRQTDSDEVFDAPQPPLDGGEALSNRTDSGKYDDSDDAFEKDDDAALSSWKKLRKRAGGRLPKRGSVLHRNTDRGDHLGRLFAKRKIRDALLRKLTPKMDDAATRDVQMSAIPEDSMELPSSKYDESFLQELRDEVEGEMNKEMESGKIMELEGIIKKYKPYLKGNESPLEIRLKNVTYTVPVDEGSGKIQTVYNASALYTVSKYLKRRVWRCEPRPEKVMVNKKILANISLVFKPGRQYLVVRRFPPVGCSLTLRIDMFWLDGNFDSPAIPCLMNHSWGHRARANQRFCGPPWD